jgi:putative membrane protein
MRKLAIMLGGAIALASCATGPRYTPADMNNPLLAPGFVAQAASANQFEIQSAQLALSSSQNAGVQAFANTLIADHSAMGQQMAAAAAAAHLPPPPTTLLPAQQAMLDRERAAGTGYAFDQAFQRNQISAHQQGITLMQNYSASGDVPALRTLAGGAIPVMQKHLSMAQSLVIAPPAPPPPPPPPPTPAPSPGRAGERG